MNYTELLGISASGKTTLKNKLISNSKKKLYEKKYIIIKYYIDNNNQNFLEYLRCLLLLFLSTKILINMRPKLRKSGLIYKESNEIIFRNQSRGFLLRLLDVFLLDDLYLKILSLLIIKFKLKKTKLFKITFKEIRSLKQNSYFKNKIKRWFIENLLVFDIQRKNNKYSCIIDEGLLQTFFIIFKFSDKKRKFIKEIMNNYTQHGKLFILKSNSLKILFRSNKRKTKQNGYIYKDFKEVNKEMREFKNYKKYLLKKVKYTEA